MWTCPCEGKGVEGGTLLGRGETRLEARIALARKVHSHIEACSPKSANRIQEQRPEQGGSQIDTELTLKESHSERALHLKSLSEALANARVGVEHDRRDWDGYLWSTTRASLGQPRVHALVAKGFL